MTVVGRSVVSVADHPVVNVYRWAFWLLFCCVQSDGVSVDDCWHWL